MRYEVILDNEELAIAFDVQEGYDIIEEFLSNSELRVESRSTEVRDGTDYVLIKFAPNPSGRKTLELRVLRPEVYLGIDKGPEFDFYSVQYYVDGFGYDNRTAATFRTRAEAEEYLKKRKEHWPLEGHYADWDDDEWVIVGQWFGKGYNHYPFPY